MIVGKPSPQRTLFFNPTLMPLKPYTLNPNP